MVITPSQDLDSHAKDEWIADSGASSHMTHSSSLLENHKSISSSVHIGDASSLPVISVGDISFGDAILHKVPHVSKL